MPYDWPLAWQGTWIWAGRPVDRPAVLGIVADPPETNQFCFLRRTFTLPGPVPASVPARATADARFVLWCNGDEVMRGPARAVPERLAWTDFDLAPHLAGGANVIAALVRWYGEAGPWWRPAAPNGYLGFGGLVFEAPTIDIRSDTSWKAHPAPYQTGLPAPRHGMADEVIDGRDWPLGWTAPGFDDSAWPPATDLCGRWPPDAPPLPRVPYTAPERADLPPLTFLPVALEPAGRVYDSGESGVDHDATYDVFDAGRIVLATPWLDVEGPRGSAVEVHAGEDTRVDGTVENEPRAYRLRYELGGALGGERVEAFEAVGFRWLGVRATGGARVTAAGAVERRYPTSPGASFACSDDRLTRLWQVGSRTLEVCATDAFLDCPGREQRAWLGDAYVHALVTYVTNTDWRLVRRQLEIGAQSRRPDGLLAMAAVGDLSLVPVTIPDYSLHWVRTLARWVERTDDLDAARRLVPVAAGIIEAFERYRDDRDGLLHHVPGWVFVDWAATERAEVIGAVDALYALALDDFAVLVTAVDGSAADVEDARAGADRSRAALDHLWDADRGVYVDAAGAEGPRRRVSQQTNALALLARPDAERADRVLAAILDRARLVVTPTTADMPPGQELACQYVDPTAACAGFDEEASVVAAQPFFRHFVHDAVVAGGRRDLLTELCLDWWPQIERGNTTFEEYWDAAPGRASRAHAWSATPTWDLTTHVLGVRVVHRDRVEVVPAVSGLEWVEGDVPTIHGLVHVRVEGSDTVVIDAPEGVTVDAPR
jgi:hypothetical protein